MASETSTNQHAMDNSAQLFTQSDKDDPFQAISAASEAKSTEAPAPEKPKAVQNATAGEASSLFGASTDVNTADALFAQDTSVSDPFFQQVSAQSHSFFDGLGQQQEQEQQVPQQNQQEQQVPHYNQQSYYYQHNADGTYLYAEYNDQGYTYQTGADSYAASATSPYDPNVYTQSTSEATSSYNLQNQNAGLYKANDNTQTYDAYAGAVNGYHYLAQPQSQTQLTSAYTPAAEQQSYDYQPQTQSGYAYAPTDGQQAYMYGSHDQIDNTFSTAGAKENYSYEPQSHAADMYTTASEQHAYSYEPQPDNAYAYQPQGNGSYSYEAVPAANTQYSTEYASGGQSEHYNAYSEAAQQPGQNYSYQPEADGAYTYQAADVQYAQQDHTYQAQAETANAQDATKNQSEQEEHAHGADVRAADTVPTMEEPKEEHPTQETDDQKQHKEQVASTFGQHDGSVQEKDQEENAGKKTIERGQEAQTQKHSDSQQLQQAPEVTQPATVTSDAEPHDPFATYQQDQNQYDYTQYQSFSYEQSYGTEVAEQKPVNAYEEEVQEVDLVAAPLVDQSNKNVAAEVVIDHKIDESMQKTEPEAAMMEQSATEEQLVPENVPAPDQEQQQQQQPTVAETGQNYDAYAYYQQQGQSSYDYSIDQDQQYTQYYSEDQVNGQQQKEVTTLEQSSYDYSAYQDQQYGPYYGNEQVGDQQQTETQGQEQHSYEYSTFQDQQYSHYYSEVQQPPHSEQQQRDIQAAEQETNEVSLEAVPSESVTDQTVALTAQPYSDQAQLQQQQQQSIDTQTFDTPPSMYTPSKPHEVGGPARIEPYYGPRNVMERSTTMPTSTVLRTASPQVDAMFPCPDPNCEGENKAKAKFCCECGRPLTALSRSTTPAMSVVSNTINAGPYAPSTMYQQQQQQQQTFMMPANTYGGYQEGEPAMLPVESADMEPTSMMHPDTNAAYGGADMYEPQAQQELPPDPLNRARGCPIVTFGFGGKLCVMFPQTVQRFTQHGAYDTGAPITKRMPSVIQVKKLKDVLGEENEMVSSLSKFVGPVLMDSKVGTKNKKKDALAYMDGKINELSQALALSEHVTKAESKLLLWRLVKTLLEVDSPAVGDGDKTDNALRAVIRPPETIEDEQQGSFSVPAYSQPGNETADLGDRSSIVLEKLQNLLLNGDRAGAVDYAMQEDLWAHALIISSCINKDVWKTVVTNFVERELSGSITEGARQDVLNVAGDKQGLRVLYSLFSGSGAGSMSEFLKMSMQQRRVKTPFGIGAPPQTGEERGDDDELSGWRTTLTLVLANRTPRDTEAITALGDILRSRGWIDAAHVCYLVSPQTSIHSGTDAPHVRLTLIGADGPSAWTDLDAYYLSELYEFAISSKQGNLALPFLQGYKLVHAWWLADLGYISEAQRYCEAIANAVKAYTKGSPYLHRQLLEKLREFSELCEAASGHSLGDTGSWLKNKLSKNSLDSLWGSLEGKFNKFVSGEDVPVEEPPVRKSTEIMANPYDAMVDGPPVRSSSAFDFRNSGRASVGPESMRRAATPTANMASEAYGLRRTSSPGARALGNFAAHGFTPMSQHNGEQLEQKQPEPENEPRGAYGYGYGSQPAHAMVSPFGQSTLATHQYGQETSMGGYGAPAASSSDWYTETYGQQTAPATNDYTPSAETQQQPSTTSYTQQEDEDDLGFGNSALKRAKASSPAPAAETPANQAPAEEKTEQEKKTTEKAEEKKTESRGWGIFSLFSRSSTPSNEKKVVKANLGDNNQFYFDEKEQRWINKALNSQPAPPPLPPPPKASPAQSNMNSPASSAPAANSSMGSKPPSATPPPPSNNALGPPGPMARGTSTSATFVQGQPPPGTPSPSGGRRGAGGRKPMRSRYVDVFNQPPPS